MKYFKPTPQSDQYNRLNTKTFFIMKNVILSLTLFAVSMMLAPALQA